MTPEMLEAITEEYAKTICALSARLANAAGNLVALSERIAVLQKRLDEAEAKLAAGSPAGET